jgi:hypothetical protein
MASIVANGWFESPVNRWRFRERRHDVPCLRACGSGPPSVPAAHSFSLAVHDSIVKTLKVVGAPRMLGENGAQLLGGALKELALREIARRDLSPERGAPSREALQAAREGSALLARTLLVLRRHLERLVGVEPPARGDLAAERRLLVTPVRRALRMLATDAVGVRETRRRPRRAARLPGVRSVEGATRLHGGPIIREPPREIPQPLLNQRSATRSTFLGGRECA